jgi:hypothetical protein
VSLVALAVQLQNMDMMREAIEQRAGQTLIAEDTRPATSLYTFDTITLREDFPSFVRDCFGLNWQRAA